MRQDLTDITMVLDRSGSMESCRSDAEGGVNAFLRNQKQLPGEALLTLVQFDTEYEFVHRGAPIQSVPEYQLVPRGSTALLDAIGRAVNETGARLAAMPEPQRPGLVVFVIVTDGQENSSHEFSKQRIHEMISHQADAYQWQFVFLGANQDAFAEAGGLGIGNAGTAKYSPANTQLAYAAASANVGRMRKAKSLGAEVVNEFTDDERAAME